MTSAPPPSGYPPGWQPPPRKKYRPSAWWFALGIGLLVAAGLFAVGMFIWLLAGFLDTDAIVAADGEPHQVTVGTDGDRMLWLEEGDDTDCTILDLESQEPIEIRTVGGSYERSDSNGDLEGLYAFSPGSGNLEVTCMGLGFHRGDDAPVALIGPKPEIDSFVIGIVVAVVVPGILGLAGFIALITTGVLYSSREPRPKQA